MPLSEHSDTTLEHSPFGLTLSGGGYRATLFHLGALRRLNEIGWLNRLDRVVSVSGGSLLLGYLMCRLPDVLDQNKVIAPDDWTETVSNRVHVFTQNDLRTAQTLKNVTINMFFRRKKRLNSSISKLAKILGQQTLGDFAHDSGTGQWPEFYILATDCVFGQAFKFSNVKGKSGHSKIGCPNVTDFSVAKACMVSASFPPIFGPFFPDFSASDFSGKTLTDDEKKKVSKIALVDGGLYDNLGANLIMQGPKNFIRLFSDAGGPLGVSSKGTKNSTVVIRYMKLMSGFIGRLNMQRVRAITKNSYALWSAQFHQKSGSPAGLGFSEDLVDNYLEDIRTDLDLFTDAEAKILENHGYAQAELALQNEFGDAYKNLGLPAPNWPYPDPAYTDAAKMKPVLKKARKGKYLSQLFRLKIKDPAPKP